MRVLAIGVATLDIINTLAAYPGEDEEVRALGQRVARGGNATNTLVVLSQLGHQCSWAGTLADEPDSQVILEDLARHRIDTSACRRYPGGKAPTSYIVLSRETGSRTIVHYRDLPEYQAEDFAAIETRDFDWIHFEGRNVAQTRMMLDQLRRRDPGRRLSLEVEKPREGIEQLFPYVDLLLFSQAYARAQGHEDAPSLLRRVRPASPGALICCAWGSSGAWMQTPAGGIEHVPALALEEAVDTLGAGDVFNAGVIDGLLGGQPPQVALQEAVALAGEKCRGIGLEGLGRERAGTA